MVEGILYYHILATVPDAIWETSSLVFWAGLLKQFNKKYENKCLFLVLQGNVYYFNRM